MSDLAALATSFFGARNAARESKKAAEAAVDHQREFAQHGVRWRVEDAKAAGVHPLFALGAQTPSFSPVQQSFDTGSGVADHLSRLGQDISRPVDATRTKGERVDARMTALALQRGELENELLRSQIARLNQASNPPMPSTVDPQPFEPVMTHPDAPHAEPSGVTEIGYGNTADGGLAPVMSEEMNQRSEDDLVAKAMWHLRNTVIPNVPVFGRNSLEARRPRSDPGPGMTWVWSRATQQWLRRPRKSGSVHMPMPGMGETIERR